MGFRFRKSITLGKFFRVNLSKSGIGVSVGVPGARVGIGPSGKRVSVGLPGTGLSYQKEWGHGDTASHQAVQTTAAPGMLAARHEKEFFAAINAHREGNDKEALSQFLAAAPNEPGAALFAALLMTRDGNQTNQVIALLEGLLQSDAALPSPLMQQYLAPDQTMPVHVTPHVVAEVPVGSMLATLLLVEQYQAQGNNDAAIGLLEDIASLSDEPAVTLSLCELYAEQGVWEGVIERGKGVESNDNVTLGIVVFYARALQAQGLHDATVHALTSALRRKKDRNPDLLRDARYWRAISYAALGNEKKAQQEWQIIYAESPDFRDVASRIGIKS